ncbi:HpaII family restriction endonuclease [Alkalihalobacterium elongatum]|uniref:HpaII family restriction endonuclease n=1 Tax=Alkalihalobacterium elongatum TaxID=2675466 RepID=UPI001C1F57A1|nr:HpaII family restriction endonuclease [Alkalihalobacterium elongatum]
MANKGEWSEPYAILKILADKKIAAYNSQSNEPSNVSYPVNKLYRHAKGTPRKKPSNITFEWEYCYDDKGESVKVIDYTKKELVIEVTIDEIKKHVKMLEDEIKNGKGSFFISQEVTSFLEKIHVITPDSSGLKRDVTIELYDFKTSKNYELGFNIKSFYGKPPTIFGASNSSNMVYELIPQENKPSVMPAHEINRINSLKNNKNRLTEISNNGYVLKYMKPNKTVFGNNLKLIDYELPIIISEMLKYYYYEDANKTMLDLVNHLEANNPCDFPLDSLPHFYRYKLKRFLLDIALGMTGGTPWNGLHEANGGYIIVNKDGSIVCLHSTDRELFQDLLLNTAYFETATRGRYKHVQIYEREGRMYIMLNLQIRFNLKQLLKEVV